MNDRDCKFLDDYLASDLPPADVAAFERHLNGCEACRQAVEDWRSLSGLLQEATRSVQTPAGLIDQIERELTAHPRKRPFRVRALAFAASAAACVLLALLYAAYHRPAIIEKETSNDIESNSSPPPAATAASVELPDNVIGLPIEIDEPGITVVWLYSTD